MRLLICCIFDIFGNLLCNGDSDEIYFFGYKECVLDIIVQTRIFHLLSFLSNDQFYLFLTDTYDS